MKNILIVPRIINKHNENYLSVDNNLLIFLQKIYKINSIEIAPFFKKKPNLIILSGGNNLIKKNASKIDIYRNNINKKILNYGIKNRIKIIGICQGAQFIADKFLSSIVKVNKHVGNHKIFYEKRMLKNNFPLNDKVNSFHNYGIKSLGKNLIPLAKAKDKTVELFIHKKLKLIGLMWHPERFKNFRKLDYKIFKSNLWN
jgi:putative glutamine amidotransferase